MLRIMTSRRVREFIASALLPALILGQLGSCPSINPNNPNDPNDPPTSQPTEPNDPQGPASQPVNPDDPDSSDDPIASRSTLDAYNLDSGSPLVLVSDHRSSFGSEAELRLFGTPRDGAGRFTLLGLAVRGPSTVGWLLLYGIDQTGTFQIASDDTGQAVSLVDDAAVDPAAWEPTRAAIAEHLGPLPPTMLNLSEPFEAVLADRAQLEARGAAITRALNALESCGGPAMSGWETLVEANGLAKVRDRSLIVPALPVALAAVVLTLATVSWALDCLSRPPSLRGSFCQKFHEAIDRQFPKKVRDRSQDDSADPPTTDCSFGVPPPAGWWQTGGSLPVWLAYYFDGDGSFVTWRRIPDTPSLHGPEYTYVEVDGALSGSAGFLTGTCRIRADFSCTPGGPQTEAEAHFSYVGTVYVENGRYSLRGLYSERYGYCGSSNEFSGTVYGLYMPHPGWVP